MNPFLNQHSHNGQNHAKWGQTAFLFFLTAVHTFASSFINKAMEACTNFENSNQKDQSHVVWLWENLGSQMKAGIDHVLGHIINVQLHVYSLLAILSEKGIHLVTMEAKPWRCTVFLRL